MHSGHELSPSSDFFSDFIYAQEGTKQKAAFFYRQNEIVEHHHPSRMKSRDTLLPRDHSSRCRAILTHFSVPYHKWPVGCDTNTNHAWKSGYRGLTSIRNRVCNHPVKSQVLFFSQKGKPLKMEFDQLRTKS